MKFNRKIGLEYEDKGTGEPVLLIHGAFIAATFAPIMGEPTLADYRLIRYHRRGHAGSAPLTEPTTIEQHADDALALMAELGLATAHVVGHSYGALVALEMALRATKSVHSLTLLEPPLGGVPSQEAFFAAIERSVNLWQAGDANGATDAFLQLALEPAWREKVAKTVPGGPEQAEADARTSFELEVSGQWDFTAAEAARLSQPVLYVWGDESPAYFQECGHLFQGWLPQTETVVIKGTNHLLQMEKPAAVAAAMADFLARRPF